MSLITKFRPGFSWIFTGSGLDIRESRLRALTEIELASGTGASQADQAFTSLAKTLAASANEDFDWSNVANTLLNPFGTPIVFAKIKGIFVYARPTNVNNVIIKPAAANGFLGGFGDASDTRIIPPGGYFEATNPVGGWTVTAGTGDKTNFANSGAGSSVVFDLEVVGTTA